MDFYGSMYQKQPPREITRQEKLSAENPFRRSKMRSRIPGLNDRRFDINSSIPAMFVDFNQVYCSDVCFLFFQEPKKQ